MKNFDDHRSKRLNKDQRTFQIGGETFIARASVRPEALTEWDEMDPEKTPAGEIYRISDATIIALIEPGEMIEIPGGDGKKVGEAHERFRQLRLREEDPLNIEDITDVLKWLIGVQSGGRPTEQPSGSGASPKETGGSSTVASSSLESPAEPELSTSGSS